MSTIKIFIMEITKSNIVGELVSLNFKAADVFSQYGIDFCCAGNISLENAAKKHNLQVDEIVGKLEDVFNTKDLESDLINRLPLDSLIEHIVENHHQYIRENVNVIPQYVNKVAQVHGGRHPEMVEVKQLFDEACAELSSHIVKEEQILFPYIKELVAAQKSGIKPSKAPFGSVQSPIEAMMAEHANEGERFRRISELTNGYVLPADGCTTYRVSLEKLKEFETDLHRHIHLENNILFIKALELEKSL